MEIGGIEGLLMTLFLLVLPLLVLAALIKVLPPWGPAARSGAEQA